MLPLMSSYVCVCWWPENSHIFPLQFDGQKAQDKSSSILILDFSGSYSLIPFPNLLSVFTMCIAIVGCLTLLMKWAEEKKQFIKKNRHNQALVVSPHIPDSGEASGILVNKPTFHRSSGIYNFVSFTQIMYY